MQRLSEFLTNHWMLSTALAFVILLFVLNEIYTRIKGGKRLNPAQAVRLINDSDPFVLDVRTAADFKKTGRVIGAVNIPLGRLAESMDQLPKDKSRPILVTCMLGSSAPQACEKLKKAGYTEVYALAGGINAWQGASMPLTRK